MIYTYPDAAKRRAAADILQYAAGEFEEQMKALVRRNKEWRGDPYVSGVLAVVEALRKMAVDLEKAPPPTEERYDWQDGQGWPPQDS